MNNINPALPQNHSTEPLMPVNKISSQPSVAPIQSTMTPNQPTVLTEQPHINKVKNVGNGSNKLWLIFLILIAMIIGFWIGYFTNEYFFKNAQTKIERPLPAISNQGNIVPTMEPEPVFVEKGYINFRGVENYINDGLNFTSDHQCVEDEIVTLSSIEDDAITIKINQSVLQEDTGEYVEELADYQVRNQECTPVKTTCADLNVERCFSLENIDGVFNLDYSFKESSAVPPMEE